MGAARPSAGVAALNGSFVEFDGSGALGQLQPVKANGSGRSTSDITGWLEAGEARCKPVRVDGWVGRLHGSPTIESAFMSVALACVKLFNCP